MTRIRQWAVDAILALWLLMPRYARIWAFMNDGPLKEKTWWKHSIGKKKNRIGEKM